MHRVCFLAIQLVSVLLVWAHWLEYGRLASLIQKLRVHSSIELYSIFVPERGKETEKMPAMIRRKSK